MSQGTAVSAPISWRVVPLRAPHLLRACPRCAGLRPFACSERFRVNASGRRLDVWLLYRCTSCELTWNLTVVERAAPEAIGAERLDAFHRNDPRTAWACAFDAWLLRRAGARPEPATPVRVERPPLAPGSALVRLALPYPVQVRLDRLLAAELGVPRSALGRHVEPQGAGAPRALRRPAFDGQLLRLVDVAGEPAPAGSG